MKFVVVLCLVVAILADASAKKGWKKKFKELEKKFNILYSKVHAQQQDIQECCNKTGETPFYQSGHTWFPFTNNHIHTVQSGR